MLQRKPTPEDKKHNLRKIQQKLNEIMVVERPNHSLSEQVIQQKSFSHAHAIQQLNEFRSITPDRPASSKKMKQTGLGERKEKMATTEPNDNPKKSFKSFSQERNQLTDYSKSQVRMDAAKLNQIGQQINAILSQNRLSKKQGHRPNSEVVSVYEPPTKKKGVETERGSKQLYLQYLKSYQRPITQNSCMEMWSSSDKQDSLPLRQPSYYTQNQQSQSQSSIRRQEERPTQDYENSKSENTTSRNKVIVSNYVNDRTPTKNLFGNLKNYQSPRLSGSRVSSLLSSLAKDREGVYNPATNISEDPNQTHIILAYSNFTISTFNLEKKKSSYVGKHNGPITCLSRVLDINHSKIFVSGARDRVVKVWSCDSSTVNYRLMHQFRVASPPLFLLVMNDMLIVLTATHLIPVSDYSIKQEPIAIHGCVRDAQVNHFHELVIAINADLYKLRRSQLVLQYHHNVEFKEIYYHDQRLYALCLDGSILSFEEGVKLKRINTQGITYFGQRAEQVLHFNKYLSDQTK